MAAKAASITKGLQAVKNLLGDGAINTHAPKGDAAAGVPQVRGAAERPASTRLDDPREAPNTDDRIEKDPDRRVQDAIALPRLCATGSRVVGGASTNVTLRWATL